MQCPIPQEISKEKKVKKNEKFLWSLCQGPGRGGGINEIMDTQGMNRV
jgi:hypothetical protein